MKKILSVVLTIFVINSFIFSQEQNTQIEAVEEADSQNQETSEAWAEIGRQGKKLLQDAGKFFKEAGTELGNSIKESLKTVSTLPCYGTWIYDNHTKTTITINENGTMSITQKTGIKSDTWTGTYSGSSLLGTITFTITEENHKTWIIKRNSNSTKDNLVWYISYVMQEDKNSVKFSSYDIPSEVEDTDFSKGIIFKRADK